ncbi:MULTISPECIES: hypothetical protein [unclassified Streptomyces]|uniref:Uncharacterized protein n=1 Tax=Streptomyces johnsoniae TaxID=3075532 RepID=A0ABU2S6J9_9ACTN|nr:MULTISPECIES: hypothetical protein [unclassified Streptomyces]MDT0443265.1 hypothetical protein [Streptomyces sp. DSM 41886]
MAGTLYIDGLCANARSADWSPLHIRRPRVRRPALVRQDSPGV